jgi:hypothetical protein
MNNSKKKRMWFCKLWHKSHLIWSYGWKRYGWKKFGGAFYKTSRDFWVLELFPNWKFHGIGSQAVDRGARTWITRVAMEATWHTSHVSHGGNMSGHLSQWRSKSQDQVLPRPSAVFHTITSTGIRGWPAHYPIVHSWSKVRYRPTRRPSKLLSLWDPINLVCAST